MDMDRYIGRLLDNRYEILEVIGTGGMAVVYKARCHRLNRLVAVKILKDENLQDEDFRRRFHAEGQAVAMLSHPNIVSVYDVSSSEEADYIVMELVDGITLKQYMEKKCILNWKETLHFAMQIAKALDHAHSRGLVHRDIKPHNVLVLKNGSVKVTDFGIARVMSKSNTLTKEALGSVHYISPEQAKGGRVDLRSDLYSLGVVMYEMITGRPPYDGETPVSVAIQHIAGGAVKPSKLNPGIPAGLEYIITKAMAHEPEDRYSSAAAMLADMDEFRKDPSAVFPLIRPVQEPAEPAKVRPVVTRTNPPVERGTDDQTKKITPMEEKPVSRRSGSTASKARAYEAEENRGRIATVAVIACSVVALVAIIVFLGMLVRDGTISTQPKTVEVPNLVNLHYEHLPDYNGIVVVRQGSAYSDDYEAGKIIEQMPKAGDVVESGRTVFVTVSLGKRPPDVTIIDLTNMDQESAENYLNNLKLNLDIQVKERYHDTVPEGHVISTSPSEGAVLLQGSKVVLTVSLGREIVMEKMPDLLKNGGRDKETAETLLNLRGFYNLEWLEVDSLLPAGTVISQSIPADEEVDVTTLITIEYSSGKEPVVEPVTISHTFTDLPVREEIYYVSVMLGSEVLMVDQEILPGETSFTMELTGLGVQEYELYINGGYYDTVLVDFGTDE